MVVQINLLYFTYFTLLYSYNNACHDGNNVVLDKPKARPSNPLLIISCSARPMFLIYVLS